MALRSSRDGAVRRRLALARPAQHPVPGILQPDDDALHGLLGRADHRRRTADLARAGRSGWRCYALLDIASIWPYNASNAAVPLAAVVLGRLPQTMADQSLVKAFGFGIFSAGVRAPDLRRDRLSHAREDHDGEARAGARLPLADRRHPGLMAGDSRCLHRLRQFRDGPAACRDRSSSSGTSPSRNGRARHFIASAEHGSGTACRPGISSLFREITPRASTCEATTTYLPRPGPSATVCSTEPELSLCPTIFSSRPMPAVRCFRPKARSSTIISGSRRV